MRCILRSLNSERNMNNLNHPKQCAEILIDVHVSSSWEFKVSKKCPVQASLVLLPAGVFLSAESPVLVCMLCPAVVGTVGCLQSAAPVCSPCRLSRASFLLRAGLVADEQTRTRYHILVYNFT